MGYLTIAAAAALMLWSLVAGSNPVDDGKWRTIARLNAWWALR